MTDFFAYDSLTWPDVAALPRDVPLLIPLGDGYDLAQVAGALSTPPRIGLLPAVPYGWRGSGLPVPDVVLGRMVANLIDSLREDGFIRVFCVCPPGLDLGLGQARITPPRSAALPHPATPADQDREKVVLLPVGHIEQHGFHLAMSTDTLIVEAIGKRVAGAVPDEAVTLPVFPYGVSTHRASFAGTLNAGGRAFEDFWLAVIDTLADRGFTRFYLLNGHGGNHSFLANVVKWAGERHPQTFCATAWLYLSGPAGVAAIEQHRRSKVGGMGHADELETSLMLHLRPDLVHMERVVDETDFVTTPNYYMDWVEGGALIANPPWADDSATGAYGAGSLATEEHGRMWLEVAVAEKVDHVAEIHEQYRRRQERRQGGFGLWGQ